MSGVLRGVPGGFEGRGRARGPIERVVTVGEGLAVFRSGPDEQLWRADQVTVGTGGAEANVAMTLAHLGVPVTWAGRVAADSLARRIVRELRAEGVTVRTVVDPDRPTGLLVKDVRTDGRTAVSYHRAGSAGSALTAADVDALDLALAPGTLVHVTGITGCLSDSAAEAVRHLVTRAHGAGALVSFDVNHRPRLWGDRPAAEAHRELATAADLVVASVDEVPFLVGSAVEVDTRAPGLEQAELAADALVGAGHQHVVVTAGAAGAFAVDGGDRASVVAHEIDAVDTVGAGDAFVGGYLAGWASGEVLIERLRLASVSGAAACRHAGDWEGAVDLGGLGDGTGVGGDPVIR
jgi:2-dehydro-3-deoxygluconokinase